MQGVSLGMLEEVEEVTLTHSRLPPERKGLTHKPTIASVKTTITTGEYDDGRLGEVTIEVGKTGDESRILRIVGILLSTGLQCGVPLSEYLENMRHHRAGTGGATDDEDIPTADSIVDYVGKWLEKKYGNK